MTARLARLGYFTIPSLLCLWLYWYGLHTWFLQDDFAWLGLRLSIHNQEDFWKALFAPMAQGTIRPLSERGFFMLFEKLFGLDALPFRMWVFGTQFVNLILLSIIVRRLTSSAPAGFLAPILWGANNTLATAMSWTSSYNQILCAFFLLLSFWLFLRFTETGDRRYYFAQWGSFVLGFGALESNVVYPALAFSYAIFCARKYVKHTLPLFPVSAAYALLHRHFAPAHRDGVYAMHWDLSILPTFWTYLRWAIGPERLEHLPVGTEPQRIAMFIFLLACVLGFLAWQLFHRQWLAAFFASWFVIVLAPLLPLRDHVSDYYLTVPTIGLAMLGAWAVAAGLRGPLAWRVLAVAACVTYVWSNAAFARVGARYNFEKSRWARTVTLGVQRALELHPGKIVLLHDLNEDAFWAGIGDNPFRLYGAQDVYFSLEAQQLFHKELQDPRYSRFALPEAAVRKALGQDMAVVYSIERDRLRNITSLYREQFAVKPVTLSSFIRGGQPLFADQFGPEWYPVEQGFRWMPAAATVRIGNPGGTLAIRGWVPQDVVKKHSMFRVSVDGLTLAKRPLDSPGDFQLSVKIPESFVSQKQLTVRFECSETFAPPGDGRRLCAAFGEFSIR